VVTFSRFPRRDFTLARLTGRNLVFEMSRSRQGLHAASSVINDHSARMTSAVKDTQDSRQPVLPTIQRLFIFERPLREAITPHPSIASRRYPATLFSLLSVIHRDQCAVPDNRLRSPVAFVLNCFQERICINLCEAFPVNCRLSVAAVATQPTDSIGRNSILITKRDYVLTTASVTCKRVIYQNFSFSVIAGLNS
jgi:hypothetical protein